jgi:hypothetical protein
VPRRGKSRLPLSKRSFRQLPADNLRPETVRSIEGAVDQRLGSHRLLFGVFRSWWRDLVELHVLTEQEVREGQRAGWLPIYVSTSATQYRNVSSIENYGFNAGYEGTFGDNRWRYGLNGTGAIARRAEQGTADLPVVVAPQLFGNARISCDLGDRLPTVALAAHYQGTRPADRALFFSPPPYAPPLVELRLTITGPFPLLKGLTYRASANYAVAERGPYTSVFEGARDPITGEAPLIYRRPELIPIERFRATIRLQYSF